MKYTHKTLSLISSALAFLFTNGVYANKIETTNQETVITDQNAQTDTGLWFYGGNNQTVTGRLNSNIFYNSISNSADSYGMYVSSGTYKLLGNHVIVFKSIISNDGIPRVYNSASGSDIIIGDISHSATIANSTETNIDYINRAGFYNNQNGNYRLMGKTTFTKVEGDGIHNKNGNAYYEIKGSLIFDVVRKSGIVSIGGTNTFTLSGNNARITFGHIGSTAGGNGFRLEGSSKNIFELSGAESEITMTETVHYGIETKHTSDNTFKLTNKDAHISIGTVGRNNSSYGWIGIYQASSNTLKFHGNDADLTNSGYISIGNIRGGRNNKKYIINLADENKKISFKGVRLYYGETNFNKAERVGIHANLTNTPQDINLGYKIGNTVISTIDRNLKSNEQTLFILSPRVNDNAIGIFLSNNANHVVNISFDRTNDRSPTTINVEDIYSKGIGRAYGVYLNGNINLTLDHLYIKNLSSEKSNVYGIYFDNKSNITIDAKDIKFSGIYNQKSPANSSVIYTQGNVIFGGKVRISNTPSPTLNIPSNINYRIYNITDGNYQFRGSTTFAGQINHEESVYGIYDESKNSTYTFANSQTKFDSMHAVRGQANGIYFKDSASTLTFDANGALSFARIVSKMGVTGGIYTASLNGLILSGKGTIGFQGIEGQKEEYGIHFASIADKATLEKESKAYFRLSGTTANSYAFKITNNTTITISNSILALDLSNPNSKLVNTTVKDLNVSLSQGGRLVLGSSNMKKNQELGIIDNLSSDNHFNNNKDALDQKSSDLAKVKGAYGNNIIDLSVTPTHTQEGKIDTPSALNAQKRNFYKTLTIGNLNKGSSKGLVGNNLIFRLYADAHGGDKITINKADLSKGNQTHYFQVNFANTDLTTLRDVGFQKDIVLVEVKDEFKNSVSFKGLNAKSNNNASIAQGEKQTLSIFRGFSDFLVNIQNKEEAGYYQYYIMSGEKLLSNGITGTYAQTGTQANINTYQMFTANLNSLNKRMGDLRDSDGNEGLWTRIYNGQQHATFGTGVTTNYTTIQLGYDGQLSSKDAKTFFGGAFSYSYGVSEFNNVRPWESGTASVLNRSNLNSFDLALYTSYVMDNGFYSDSVIKATHINNNLSTTGNDRYKVNTQGVSLSQEIGFRARLPFGLFLDPQAELSYAYLGEQDFTQNWTDPNDSSTSASLRFHQAEIYTLRSRLGLNLGMDFKEFFDKDSKSNATLYFGAYYVYDYIEGGNITMDNLDPKVRTTLNSNPYSSTGRAVLNLGTNVTFAEGTKLYIDLERSFGGKIATEYQVNLGVRVGFGEKTERRIIQTKPFKQPKWTITPKSEEEKKKPVNWKAPTKEELEARKTQRAKEAQEKKIQEAKKGSRLK